MNRREKQYLATAFAFMLGLIGLGLVCSQPGADAAADSRTWTASR